MLNFDRSSLSQKLTLVSVLSTGSALIVVYLAFAFTSVFSHTEDETKQLSILAGVIGTNSVTALLFADRRQAEQTLGALNVKHEIAQAALFDRDGQLFARYAPRGRALQAPGALRLAPQADAPSLERIGTFWSPGIRLYRPVTNNTERIGSVMIEADLVPMWLEILKQLGAISVATAFSFLIALLLARRFKNIIAAPITELINAAQKVSSSQSYTHRIAHQRSDELGTLIDSFNNMLSQIESRDATLVNYRDQLERQVGVRTEQLEKAKNAAEAASQAKSAFLATMSHEIRTPMNGVLGMTELLLASELSERQRHYTSTLQRSGEHLLVIINDILDFSKIEAGKLTVEYIHFNFRELLDDIDTVFSPQAQAKDIRLEFAIANDIPVAICGDPNRLRQVIVNLLGNAIKFTESGKISVRVHVTGEDEQAVSLRFEVHDTGIGVASEAQSRIFDSFSQADGSTTRKHGGTGLGLAISKQLVELMGGEIGVDNALTQGSIFWFAVNFDKRRVGADAASSNQKTTPGLRALIVDEKPLSRELLGRQLAGWHLRSDSAGSAIACLQKLREAAQRGMPYDVALLDMELSRSSGLALAAAIKADPAIAGVRLLLLSSEGHAADTAQRREAGIAFQLIKPARECDLLDCIVAPMRTNEGMASGAPGPASMRADAPRKRLKALLAEDNPVNVEVAVAMLEGLGLDVVCAADGVQALSAARANDFDLILMDCQMPVMDGFAATAEIRRREQQAGRARSMPIIAITANALQGDRESCLAAGMNDYLSKPFTQQALGETIGRWITLPRAAAADQREAPRRPAPARRPGASPARAGINRHALANIRALSTDAGGALLERVIHAYVDDTPQHFQALRLAISAQNTNGMRKAAHSLKGSSANVGAETLAQLCSDMERLARNNSSDGAFVLLNDMESEFLAVRDSLGALLENET